MEEWQARSCHSSVGRQAFLVSRFFLCCGGLAPTLLAFHLK